MRRYLLVSLLVLSFSVHASSTLRVGSQVLVVGDSAARASELLGKPSYQSHRASSRGSSRRGRRGANTSSAPAGQQWQYRQSGHTVTLTIADGKVSDIQEDWR